MGFSSLLWGNSLKAKHVRLQRAKLKAQTFTWHLFCFTLSSCDQSTKRYQTGTANPKYASSSCVSSPGSKDLALNTSHRDIKNLVTPTSSKTSSWTSSGYSLSIDWQRRMGLGPYSPVLEVNQGCVSNLYSWHP